jgi:histone H3/H4
MTISNTLLQEPPSDQAGELPARLLAIATLQILANSTQFTSVRPVSLSTLTDVAAGYLELIAQAARKTADHSGRTQINGWDLSGVLENLEGPGAISGLQNWCTDNLTTANHTHPSQKQPVEKLARLAQNLKGKQTSKQSLTRSDYETKLNHAIHRIHSHPLNRTHHHPLIPPTHRRRDPRTRSSWRI